MLGRKTSKGRGMRGCKRNDDLSIKGACAEIRLDWLQLCKKRSRTWIALYITWILRRRIGSILRKTKSLLSKCMTTTKATTTMMMTKTTMKTTSAGPEVVAESETKMKLTLSGHAQYGKYVLIRQRANLNCKKPQKKLRLGGRFQSETIGFWTGHLVARYVCLLAPLIPLTRSTALCFATLSSFAYSVHQLAHSLRSLPCGTVEIHK